MTPRNPLPRLLRASNWTVFSVPFLFRVENAGRFLREVRTLRSSVSKAHGGLRGGTHRGRMDRSARFASLVGSGHDGRPPLFD